MRAPGPPEDQGSVDRRVVRRLPRPERDPPEGRQLLHPDQRQVGHARDRTPGGSPRRSLPVFAPGRTAPVQLAPVRAATQWTVSPPSTVRICPTTYFASGEAR